MRRLFGGITSLVHALRVEGSSGVRRSYVIKRWTGREPWEAEAQGNEVRLLQALSATAVPAPELVASTNGDDTDGGPALLMGRCPGRVHLNPSDSGLWLRRTVAVLPAIHAADVGDVEAHAPVVRERPVPEWTSRPDLWRAALAVLAEPPPPGPVVFVHGDFQFFNLLWSRGEVTGVVDWSWATRSCPDIDAAHCRLNLAVMYSVDLAERLRRLYEVEAGRKLDPWWDLYRLRAYDQTWKEFLPVQIAGRKALDVTGMDGRVEDLIESVLRRL